MIKYLKLELIRTKLTSYNKAVAVIGIILFLFLYLLAAIPTFDPEETDLTILNSYHSLLNVENIVTMAIFSVLASVLGSKLIINEYTKEKVILLFIYPVGRTKIFYLKISIIFFYTVLAMLISNGVLQLIFFAGESIHPFVQQTLTLTVVMNSLVSLFLFSLLAGLLGILAIFIGFRKKSIAGTIVAGCIIACIFAQVMAAALNSNLIALAIFILLTLITSFCLKNLSQQVEQLEV